MSEKLTITTSTMKDRKMLTQGVYDTELDRPTTGERTDAAGALHKWFRVPFVVVNADSQEDENQAMVGQSSGLFFNLLDPGEEDKFGIRQGWLDLIYAVYGELPEEGADFEIDLDDFPEKRVRLEVTHRTNKKTGKVYENFKLLVDRPTTNGKTETKPTGSKGKPTPQRAKGRTGARA